MSVNEASYFSLGLNNEVFILGKPEVAKHLSKQISALTFLISVPTQELMKKRSHFHIVLAPCNFDDANEVNTVSRCLRQVSTVNPQCHIIVYSISPSQPSFNQFLFSAILGSQYTVYGPEKDLNLRAYLKMIALRQKNSGSFQQLEQRLNEALSVKNLDVIRKIYNKLCQMDKEHYLTLRLKAIACRALGQFEREAFFLKHILEQNPQDLWAINATASLYSSNKHARKGLELIKQHTDYGISETFGEPDKNNGEIFDYLKGAVFPKEIIRFLQSRSNLFSAIESYDDAIACLDLALKSKFSSDEEKALTLYQIGKVHVKAKKFVYAKKYFEHCIKIGGNKLNKARKDLDALKSLQHHHIDK